MLAPRWRHAQQPPLHQLIMFAIIGQAFKFFKAHRIGGIGNNLTPDGNGLSRHWLASLLVASQSCLSLCQHASLIISSCQEEYKQPFWACDERFVLSSFSFHVIRASSIRV